MRTYLGMLGLSVFLLGLTTSALSSPTRKTKQRTVSPCAGLLRNVNQGLKIDFLPKLKKRRSRDGRTRWEPGVKIWDAPNIWTPGQQRQVRAMVAHSNEGIDPEIRQFAPDMEDLDTVLTPELAQPLRKRINFVLESLNKHLPKPLRIADLGVHIEGSRTVVEDYHIDSGGALVLALSELGQLTEFEGVPTKKNDGKRMALFTDSQLHRTPAGKYRVQLNKPRLIVFVFLSTEENFEDSLDEMILLEGAY